MKITYFTRPEAFDLIQRCGYIDLEGSNAARGWDGQNRKTRRSIYKLIGRHIWFTQSTSARTASGHQIAIHFDSDKIGAVRWSDYKNRFKNSKEKWRMVQAFDESANSMGDDPNDYWLVDKPIPIEAAE